MHFRGPAGLTEDLPMTIGMHIRNAAVGDLMRAYCAEDAMFRIAFAKDQRRFSKLFHLAGTAFLK